MTTWTVDDVMTRTVVSVDGASGYRNLVDVLIEHHVSAVPVIDVRRHVIGVVSEADLLCKIEYAGDGSPRLFESRRRRADRAKAASRTAADLMSSPPVVARVGTSIAAAARLMAAQGVKRLPVVDELGRLAGIVSRSDLLKVHLRPDDRIAADIRTGVLDPFLADGADGVSAEVADGSVTLTGRVDRRSDADLIEKMTHQVPGVVDVVSSIAYAYDDRDLRAPSSFYGVP